METEKAKRNGARGRLLALCCSVGAAACLAVAALAGSLVAQADEGVLVRDMATGAGYEGITQALEAAGDGDTLQILGKLETSGPVAVDKNVTLDLHGNEVTVDATLPKGTSMRVQGDGLSLSQGAVLRVEDTSSSNTGRLSVRVGSMNEIKKNKVYHGVEVDDGATFVLDDAHMDVAYAGESVALPSIGLHGIALKKGSFTAEGGAGLVVKAAAQKRSYGAQDVMGIWASADSTGNVTVGDDASIEVTNNAAPQYDASPDYPDYVGQHASQSESNGTLAELEVGPGSDLDKALQEAFRKKALCDAAGDTAGNVYGARIYYAPALRLGNGMTVWAYSDQLPVGDIGELSSIVAKHVFVRVGCSKPMNAYGVYAESGFAGTVAFQGKARVATGEGNAVALCGVASAFAWKADEGKLEVSSGDVPYALSTGDDFDLRDYMTVTGFSGTRLAYPKDNRLKECKLVQPQAVKTSSGEPEAVAGTLTDSNVHDALYGAMDEDVTVTFAGLCDEKGAKLEDVEQTLGYGKTLKAAGEKRVSSADYVKDGTRYEFVGWKLTGDSSVYAHDPDAVYETTPMTSSVKGATSGHVTYTARYCAVPSGEHLVTFRLEDELFAYAVKDGAVPSYVDARGIVVTGRDSKDPSKVTTEDGYSFEFSGWAPGLDGDSLVKKGETLYASDKIPPATEDASYTARFAKKAIDVSATVRYKAVLNGQLVDLTKTNASISWQDSALKTLNAYATIGTETSYRGVLYTLVGWTLRESDKEALYTSDFRLDPTSVEWGSASVRLFGVYKTADRCAKVTFHSGKGVLGQTVSVPMSATVKQALSYAGIEESSLVPPAANQELRGWNTSGDASAVLATSTTKVGLAGDYAESMDIYAIWGVKRHVVIFYDSDRKTKLGSYYADDGSTVEDSNPDFEVTLTGVKKDTFEGWVTSSGKKFSTGATKVTKDLKVYAKYKTYAKGTGSVSGQSGASGDLTISGKGASGATTVQASPKANAAKAASVEAAPAAQGTAASTTGSKVGSGDEGTVASRVALGVILGIIAAMAALVALWFKRRRDSDDEPIADTQARTEAERIQF